MRKRSRKIDRMLPLGKWRKISYHFPKANAISPYNNSFICSICNKKMHMKLHYGNYVCIYCYGKALKSICEGGIMDITPVNVGGYMQERVKMLGSNTLAYAFFQNPFLPSPPTKIFMANINHIDHMSLFLSCVGRLDLMLFDRLRYLTIACAGMQVYRK